MMLTRPGGPAARTTSSRPRLRASLRLAGVALATGVLTAVVGQSPLLAAGAADSPRVGLGTLGGSYSYAMAVNDSGQVVGQSETANGGPAHAFSWTQADGMVDLTPGGGYSSASAVSNGGQVVGTVDGHVFSWTQAGGKVDLGTFVGGNTSTITGGQQAVSDNGQVVGQGDLNGGTEAHAFVWTPGAGGIVDLGTLGGNVSEADAVNASGKVVGSSTTADGVRHAFSWTPPTPGAGGMVDLGTLGGDNASEAIAVNASGEVAGRSYSASTAPPPPPTAPSPSPTPSSPPTAPPTAAPTTTPTASPTAPPTSPPGSRPVLWSPTGVAVDLGTLGGSYGGANAVNDSGQVVGFSDSSPDGITHAFSWTPPVAGAGGMVDLGTLGGSYSEALAVNDSGAVVGRSYTSSSEQHAFLWTPAGGMVDLGTLNSTSEARAVAKCEAAGSDGSHALLWQLCPGSVSVTVPPAGGTITTDPGNVGASAAVPLQTLVTVPAGLSGTLSVTPQTTTTVAPTGFSLFNSEVVLAGPAATGTSPYQVTFTVDSTALNGIAPSDVQVFRNGVALSGCIGPVAAAPDPCIASRGFAPGVGGDATVTVRTSHFSTWSLGRLAYSLVGPFQPVDPAPVVNTVKAGSAIPIKFKLGGNKGLNVLADGYPKSGTISCGRVVASGIEQTVSSAKPALTYDRVSTRYTYTWKTPEKTKGCRDLVLRFRDGSQLRALFNLR